MAYRAVINGQPGLSIDDPNLASWAQTVGYAQDNGQPMSLPELMKIMTVRDDVTGQVLQPAEQGAWQDYPIAGSFQGAPSVPGLSGYSYVPLDAYKQSVAEADARSADPLSPMAAFMMPLAMVGGGLALGAGAGAGAGTGSVFGAGGELATGVGSGLGAGTGSITSGFSGLSNLFGGQNPLSSISNLFTGTPGGGASMSLPSTGGMTVGDEGFGFLENFFSNPDPYSGFTTNTLGATSTLGDFANPGFNMWDPSTYGSSGYPTGGQSWLSKLFSPSGTGGGGSGGGGGGDTASLINRILSGGAGLYDLFGTGPNSARGINEAAANRADPFGPERGAYAGMLRNYMTNPGSYALSPAAQFELDTGTENLTRSNAARGMLGSGNILGELMKYGQGVASQDYWKMISALTGLSGANTGSPAAAGSILAGRYNQRNNAMANIGGAIGGGTKSGGGGIGDIIMGLGGQLTRMFA